MSKQKMARVKIKKMKTVPVSHAEFGIKDPISKCLRVWLDYTPQIQLRDLVEVNNQTLKVIDVTHSIGIGVIDETVLYCRPLMPYEV